MYGHSFQEFMRSPGTRIKGAPQLLKTVAHLFSFVFVPQRLVPVLCCKMQHQVSIFATRTTRFLP